MTAIAPSLSPCRRHPCSREHADLVATFRSLAEDWLREAERVTGGYEADLKLYVQSHPRPNLKNFLRLCRRPREDEDQGRAA